MLKKINKLFLIKLLIFLIIICCKTHDDKKGKKINNLNLEKKEYVDSLFQGNFYVTQETEETTTGTASISYSLNVGKEKAILKTNTFHEPITCNGEYKATMKNNVLELYYSGNENGCILNRPNFQIIKEGNNYFIKGVGGEATINEWVQIQKKILSNNISEDKKRGIFSSYENNDNFFIKTFDVNKDGVLDKIVSNKPYQENTDLFVFYGNKGNGYQLVLETTNFSEDGGNIIESIYPITNKKGLMIKTYFPDRGYYEKEYYIVPQNNTWTLTKITYKTMSDISENSVKYVCDVTQNIDITKSGWTDKINEIPEENERSKKCRIESNSNKNKQYFIQDPDGFTNLRKDKTTTSEVLEKIKSGEQIKVLDNAGDWFLIKTKEGKEGYVHKSRIKSEY